MEQRVYKTIGDRELKVDIFQPDDGGEGPRAAIAFFHGGGWAFGSPSEFHGACKRYAQKGVAAFSFQYRLSRNADGSFPHPQITPVESVKDARSALRWLRENAEELGIDPDHIAASGQSAGGQLALSTELIDDINEASDDTDVSPRPNAILLFSSNYNTVEQWLDYLMGERRGEIWSISPYHNLRPGMPPMLCFHGKDDGCVSPYILEFFEARMREIGNPCEVVWLPGRTHYLGQGCKEYAEYFDEGILEQTDAFLERLGFLEG